jgi:mevalonate kinase
MKAVAPGKLILSGEHAVVYGAPAIAMAIDRSAVFEMTPQQGEQISFDLSESRERESITLLALSDLKRRVHKNYRQFVRGEIGIREVLAKPADLFKFAFINTLDGFHRHIDTGLCLKLRSSIPVGCGMGSSAATVLSEIRALGHFLRVDFKPEWYYEYSMEAERLQHGRPSGVDSYISLYGGCASFQGGNAIPMALPRLKMYMVHTGLPTSTTGECVMAVKERFGDSGIWSAFEAVTRAMQNALNDHAEAKVHWLVRENNRLLCEIGVVPMRVQQFIADVEAWGGSAKICGAGSVSGEAGGIVLVFADEAPTALCATYGYSESPVRGDPLGTRMV